MTHRTSADLARALWADRPLAYTAAMFFGVLGTFVLLDDLGALLGFGSAGVLMRYIAALAGAMAAYQQASAWRADALERAYRASEAAEAAESDLAGGGVGRTYTGATP